MILIKQNLTLITIIVILVVFYAVYLLSTNTQSEPQPIPIEQKTNTSLKITNSLQARIDNNPSQQYSITIQFTEPINTDQKQQLENYLQNPQYSFGSVNIGEGLATGDDIRNYISKFEFVKQIEEGDINQLL